LTVQSVGNAKLEVGAVGDGPLAGIKVVEWAHVHFGPGAGMFLTDMGADVIHVESREGDAMRHYATLFGANFLLDHGRNTFTEDLLRNKKSLTVDLAKPEAREIVRRLADDADVFITNYRPAAAIKNQLDYATLSARNPRLVYAQGTSYGTKGPEKDSPGLEMMGLARGGLMLGSAVAGSEPIYPTMGLNDRLGSIGLLISILSALVARERQGIGQLVETSLLGWTVNLQASAISYAANVGKDLRPLPRADADDPCYNVYRLKDGSWIALGMTIHPHKYWPLLCQALGLQELIDDSRFTTPDKRRSNFRDLIAIFDNSFGTLTWKEWDDKIHEYELISCKVNALTDLAQDEQILANGYMVKRSHPDLGEWWYVPTPVQYEKTPISFRSAAPQTGENTDELLCGLGYTPEQISDLREREVV
jgi:crotonobetainyl-CoA:carnitine CoA-transferase CaiB-like acyl-CoA transferase